MQIFACFSFSFLLLSTLLREFGEDLRNNTPIKAGLNHREKSLKMPPSEMFDSIFLEHRSNWL